MPEPEEYVSSLGCHIPQGSATPKLQGGPVGSLAREFRHGTNRTPWRCQAPRRALLFLIRTFLSQSRYGTIMNNGDWWRRAMARNVVQFQKGLSEPAFEQQYGTEE